jgi:tRNA-dihydrouridine synthase B
VRPFAALAPMAGITDLPFRLLCRRMGCPMAYTEMVSAQGLFYGGPNTHKLLRTEPGDAPLGVQIFGRQPEVMGEMAARLAALRPAVIDINMGCPAPKITGPGEGSALMREPELAARIVRAVVAGAGSVPVSVKFRKGWDEASVNAVDFARRMADAGAAALCVHGRTRMQFYAGRADWEIIEKVKAAVEVPVIGNGDVFTPQDAVDLVARTGCDGVMVARGAQGNPWIFAGIAALFAGEPLPDPPTPRQRMDLALEHYRMMIALEGERGAVLMMRKHLAWYIKGLRGATRMRGRLNQAQGYEQVAELLGELVAQQTPV